MPKVLLLRAEWLPASETFILSQAAALRRYEPGLAALKHLRDGLDVSRTVAVLDSGNFAGKIARRVYAQTGFAPGFQRKLSEWKPDIAHVHFAMDACAFLPVLRRLGVPLVVTLHGYDVGLNDAAHARSAQGRIFLRRREALWSEAARFLCVSEHLRRVAIERGFPEGKLQVHRTGVAVQKCEPRTKIRESLVLFVGRLVEKKGCNLLLAAMLRVEREIPDARLVVVGDGPLRRELEAYGKANLRQCEFAGAQTHARVREWMERAAVLAAPSMRAEDGDTEGLPTVVLEAMERGLPVIAASGTGAEEAVIDGETGFLMEQRDVAGLAETLMCLLQDHDLAKCFGAGGRRRIEGQFDIAQKTARLEKIYDSLCGSR